ncbi:uncharacterized protein [Epargyreus clarus]|uniref:uncharacterized protein isoform X2 n=1 Tax=Epargyreus clarus TaxID=520877 RepID=UPI003C302F5F
MCSYVLYIVTVFVLKGLDALEVETVVPVEAVVGHIAELPCNVTAETEDDKLNILAWYRNGSSTAFYSGDLRGEPKIVMSGGDRYRRVSSESEGLDRLQILSVRAADAGLYHCLADFADSPSLKTYIELVVIEPPQRLWVIHENGTRVMSASADSNNTSRNIGPYFVGDVIHLFCVVFGGKPQPSLSWWTQSHLLKNTTTILSEQRVRGDLTYGPLRREDHGRVLTCFSKNNEKTLPLSIDIIIDMYLPPELVSIRVSGERADKVFEGRVSAGESLALQCRVLGARPLPPVVWRLNDSQLANVDQNVTKEPSQRLIVSEIRLAVVPEYDEARVTCCAPAHRRDAAQYVCAASLPLCVLYPPILQIVVKEDLLNDTLSVVKGSNVSLNCYYQANPSVYQITWFHEDGMVTETADSEEATIQSTLTLAEVGEGDGGEYVCAATNEQGTTYSEPIIVDVTYPAYCEDESTVEYGIGERESVNLTCKVKANPEPSSYRWMFISETNASRLRTNYTNTTETDVSTLLYERPNGTAYTLIYCWGYNDVATTTLPHTKCSFLVTDETAPQPPAACRAAKSERDITVTCEEGHDGGLQQKFKFIVQALDSEDQLVSIINQEPKFIIPEPKEESYKFVLVAFNDKGDSKPVEIEMESIVDETESVEEPISAVANITTLALALCGGVLLLALAACGLVLCAHERAARADLPHDRADPPLCAYNTEESNCETFHGSDDGSECNIRRTDSFRRAMSKYPSKNYDVRRTSSFHSARYMNDNVDHDTGKYNEIPRHSASCRVHSLQNINRKREMDVLCDHLVMHLPPETNYSVAKPMNTFYTMPRKMRHKAAKEISDETSEITQTSDGFSLPPPPDEFGTYRAASRIKDVPTKAVPTYSTIIRKNSTGKDPNKYSNVIVSPLNTVGLPTISGGHSSIYTYPDDDHHGHPINTNPFDDSP